MTRKANRIPVVLPSKHLASTNLSCSFNTGNSR